MGKIAFVFSGQGDQFPGMGRELAQEYAEAADVFALCDAIRPNTSAQCFDGTEEELKETKNTQPCLFAMELAAARALMANDVQPDALAGFSLGEVTAATVGGLFDAQTGFSLVCRRADWMQEAAQDADTAMVAVLKLSEATVRELCSRFAYVYPVNFNCPGQITVSGLASQMPNFSSAVKAAGGRAIPLKVGGAFHSPFMRKAAERFAETLKGISVQTPSVPLYSDKTGLPYPCDDESATLLAEQICSPVLWETLIKNMIADGIDTFIEVGPGQTLTRMIRKIDASVKASTYTEILAEVKAC